MPPRKRTANRRTKQRRAGSHEPLAIVGIGLHLPGDSHDTSSFWQMLCQGTDAITEIPEDRWSITSFYDSRPNMPGQSHSKWGGFIEGNDQFDAAFFSVSPHEAESMDPQQRWLLETAWHAFEDAGEVPERSAAANIGVYVGISYNEYARFTVSPVDHVYSVSQGSGAFDATGTALSISANRISHAFNFKGPSMAVDTACSSSLVAFNEACRAVWDGECEGALVAGVNHIIDPSTWIAFCSLGALSPDGRCKAFDETANGFVRGEGVGAVYVKPLKAALRDRNRIYACVRGTAVNQDGYTPAIAMPNRESQARLIRHTCDLAGISPEQIDFVEAHGTGTGVGDPIEANALGDALGSLRSPDRPLLIGSVKTNIGHLESAAGIAGLIKAALCLHHRHLPPSLHFENPNPAVDFEAQRLEVVTENRDLSRLNGDVLHASVNSFGFGGANAHAILESAPPLPARPTTQPAGAISGRHFLTFSARSTESLRNLAGDYAARLKNAPETASALSAAAAEKRVPLPERLSVIGQNLEDLAKFLEEITDPSTDLSADLPDGVHFGTSELPEDTRPVFVFSGQGSQWAGMGRELYEASELFREILDRCDAGLRKLSRGKFQLLEEMFADGKRSHLDHTAVAQPAIFAIQVALAELWQAWGIQPGAVIGHSVGEVAAAHIAGALTFDDAIRVIYHRGTKMESARAGKMIAAEITPEQALEAIGNNGGGLSLAACNGPSSVSISGEVEAVEHLYESLQDRNVFCRYVPVDYAFHSDLMDPVRTRLVSSLDRISPKRAKIPIYSTVTGSRLSGTRFDAGYWWRNVRETVRFSEAISQLADEGRELFIEINAHPVLQPSLVQCLAQSEGNSVVVPSLRRNSPEPDVLLGSLAEVHQRGVSVDWANLLGEPAEPTDLPLYPFNRQRFWRETPAWRLARLTPRPHPWLHVDIPSHRSEWMFFPDRREHPFLNDHVVSDRIVFPASGYIEMALAVAKNQFGTERLVFEEVEFQRVLFIPRDGPAPVLRAELDNETGSFRILSTSDENRKIWTLHAIGRIRATETPSPPADPNRITEAQARCPDPKDIAESYQLLEDSGLRYGPLFRGLKEASFSDSEGWSRIEIPEAVRETAEGYLLHPVLLDAAFHVMALLPNKTPGTFLPVEMRRIRIHQTGARSALVHARLIRSTPSMYETEITMLDKKGGLIAEIEGFRLLAVESARTDHLPDVKFDFLEETWIEAAPRNADTTTGPDAFLPSPTTLARTIRRDRKAESARILPLSSESLYEAAIGSALHRMGLAIGPGDRFTLNELAKQLRIPKRNRAKLDRVLRSLAGTGVIKGNKDTWRTIRRLDPSAFDQLWKEAIESHPSLSTELILINLITNRLPDLIAGRISLPKVLAEPANDHLSGQLHGESAWFSPCHRDLTRTLEALIVTLPTGRKLRVLEIDGAERRTAANLLAALPEDRIDFILTDPDSERLGEATDRLQHFPNLFSQTLNIRKALSGQEIEPDSFDVILSIHHSRLSKTALRRVRQLLRPGGLLLIAQPSGDAPFREIIRGFDAPPRPTTVTSLKEAGFQSVAQWSGDSPLGHRFLAARNGPTKRIAKPENKPARTASQTWLLYGDPEIAITARLRESLEDQRQKVRLIAPEEFPTSRDEAIEQLSSVKTRLGGILYLGGIEESLSKKGSIEEIETSRRPISLVPLFLSQALDALSEQHSKTAFWIATRGTQAVPGDNGTINLAQAPLAGMVRVIESELRSHAVRHADLSTVDSEREFERFSIDVLTGSEETQIAYRGETRFVPRLRTCQPHHQGQSERLPLHENPAQLITRQAGVFDHLALQKIERKAPSKGEVEVEIHAAGLNFRDVMKALGIYPSDAEDAGIFGDDFAGTVTRTGPGVRNLNPGDRVVGVRPGCFRSHLTLPAALIFPLPDRISFQEAATIPSIYLTAWFALHELGRLAKGERVLIHAGAGGVGLAAIRLAQHTGAEIFATAGSPLKRDFLRKLGVDHVFDSRTLEFADEIFEATGGEGVDIVLNSLSGQAITKSLECLREGGRFLELGKRDIYENSVLGLRPFKNCLTYVAIDLAKQIAPARFKKMVASVRRMIDRDIVRPLPHTVFPISRAPDAFRHMAQGKHIGKIVFDFENQSATPENALNRDPVAFRKDGAYLVIGGTRGFGLEVARFLAEHGAGHLVLVSRTGKPDPESESALARLEQTGARIHLRACDVASESALKSLLEEIRNDIAPLQGIFHGAMVLADEVLSRMTPEQFDAATRPKILGGWNLHRQTLNDSLDHFVLFSSISVLVGNPGQANYVAANAFLDALARYRRNLGKPGLSIAWDRLNESGYAARTEGLAEHFERMGWKGLSNREAIRGLGLLLQNDAVHMAVSNVEWAKWRSAAGLGAQAPRYSDLVSSDFGDDGGENLAERVRQQFFAAPPDERIELVENFIVEQVAKVLRISPNRLSKTKPLNEQGLDSLMAVELFGVLENQLGVPIPPSQLIENPTIEKAATSIARILETQEGAPTPADSSDSHKETVERATRTPEGDLAELGSQLKQAISNDLLPSNDPPREILLTGTTGFFGPYLVRALLEETDARLHCLVRAKDQTEGIRRIRSRLKSAGITIPEKLLSARVKAIPGDLSETGLGLSESTWNTLAGTVDTVIHGAASVNHAADYPEICTSDVDGTTELLRFSATGKTKHCHFLSSIAVFSAENTTRSALRSESARPDSFDSLFNGYGQCKAVSEELVRIAADRGLPANVFRIGHLVSESEPSLTASKQALWLVYRACLYLEFAPDYRANLQITPVTWAAAAIARAVQQRLSPGTWHVAGSHTVTFNDLIGHGRRLGHRVESLSRSDWVSRLTNLANDPRGALYARLFPVAELADIPISEGGILGDTGFRKHLATWENLPPESWDDATLVEALAGIGFLPDPNADAAESRVPAAT